MTFYRASAKGDLPMGDHFVTSFHISSSQTLSAVHTTATNAIDTFWTALKALLPIGTVLRDITTTSLIIDNGKNDQALDATRNVPGTGTGNAVSQNAAILVSLRTAKASRAGRGRQYFPAPVSAAVDAAGKLTGASITTIGNAYAALATSINTSHQLVVLHGGFTGRGADGKPQYQQLSSDPVTLTQVRNVLATQRRRTNQATVTYT